MAVLRDPNNITSLEDGQVLVNFGDDPKVGKSGKLGKGWHTLGILAEDLNVALTRTMDEETVKGGGFGVVSRSFTPGDVTGTVTTLEDNAVTRYIMWPDTEVKDGVSYRMHSAKVAQANVLIVRKHENGITEMEASRLPARLRAENVGRGKSAAGREITMGFEPDKQKIVFEYRAFELTEEGVVEVQPKIIVEDTAVEGEHGTVGGAKATDVTEEKIEGANS